MSSPSPGGGENEFKGFGGGEGIRRSGEEIQREGVEKGVKKRIEGEKEERKEEKGREKEKKRRGKGNKSGCGTPSPNHSISTYLIYTYNCLTTQIATYFCFH